MGLNLKLGAGVGVRITRWLDERGSRMLQGVGSAQCSMLNARCLMSGGKIFLAHLCLDEAGVELRCSGFLRSVMN